MARKRPTLGMKENFFVDCNIKATLYFNLIEPRTDLISLFRSLGVVRPPEGSTPVLSPPKIVGIPSRAAKLKLPLISQY